MPDTIRRNGTHEDGARVSLGNEDARRLLAVLTAFKRGDFSVRMPIQEQNGGATLEIAKLLNEIIALNQRMAAEFRRIEIGVGKEGNITQRASLMHGTGSWAACVESVNTLIGNLIHPTNEMARVIGAVAKGDLSQRIPSKIGGRELKGQFLRTAKIVNSMVTQLGSFASEVTRVAREVGTEGKLGGQAQVKGVAGTWKDLTDNVNSMAANLTTQVRNIADVTTAVAKGDLSKKITVKVSGEILRLKNTINTMVDQLNSFASEVTRVAREVGTDGKLGGQAQVKGVAGTWKDLTDNVNSMAANLTSQVRNIADVTTAIAKGDLSKKITVDVKGEILELKDTINKTVDQLGSFASEVTRVAREVGTDGKLGGQAQVRGVAGTWKDLTDNVNSMASNLTSQVRNIADVTTAVAKGDLSKKITVDVKGEILELKNTINTMVDQLNSFASEVTRVARGVGTEGKLGGQAHVKGVAGTWKDLTDNVNSMAANLTTQVRNIAEVTTAVAKGDLSKKITVDVRGEILELKNTINTMVDQLNSFASEVTRVAREVGIEGKLGGQAQVKGVAGTWKDLTDNVNSMASNLTSQVRNIANVTTAVAKGDLSKKITVDVRGEILELKDTINTMVVQLNSFASEVTRVAREVGTEGKLGGQAQVKGVAGTWKDLTDNVNSMAANLTTQVRAIAKVVTAVANGDLKRKLVLDVKGEIAELAETINGMIDTLAVFADQVTSVAREVGIEGKLGGQASVPGAAGLWRHLTDNVNQLAANLTTQVRAIADVATAVTKGDLTRSISVEAQGEVAALKDNINEMIRNLKETTRKNTEQDWLKTNLAKFTRMLQGQRDLLTVSQLILSELAPLVEAQCGVFYITDAKDSNKSLDLLAGYAYQEDEPTPKKIKMGEGLIGQCAVEKESFRLADIPPGYVKISSGLGEAEPRNIAILPAIFEGEVKAVIELASFRPLTDVHMAFLEQLTESIGIVLNTIAATTRTEELLKQSQALTEELKETNRRLEQQNQEVEQKNREVEQARRSLEEKAAQLALTSKYKSQFLANTSHELRTPLNSLLLLSKILSENSEGNLTPKQIEFAKTIHSSGSDLLELINDILDLSKIESGTMVLDIGPVPFRELQDYVERTSRHFAVAKGLEFSVDLAPKLPETLSTDSKRLQQVLKNLLSNAFKFTDKGKVALRISVAKEGWRPDHAGLAAAGTVIALAVSDTGIGIAKDKQQIIFEAFQQADGTTNRKYGGTGLGLSISREIARLLGGDLRLESAPGEGSTFTLFLPLNYAPQSRQLQTLAPPAVPEFAETPVLAGGGDGFIGATVEAPSFVEAEINDDRGSLEEGDQVLLIVDDDVNFARILLDMARTKGFKALTAFRAERALALAHEYRPHAIILDIRLPDADGWTVLDRLKHNLATRHIPVFVISANDEERQALRLGAMGFLQKPAAKEALESTLDRVHAFIERPVKKLLLIEPDKNRGKGIADLLGGAEIETTIAASGRQAIAALKNGPFDSIILDPSLSEQDMAEFTKNFHEERDSVVPIVIYGTRKLAKKDEDALARAAKGRVIKDAASPEQLLDRMLQLLHRPIENLPAPQRQVLETLSQEDPILAGRKVLIVDDDVRNIFALATVLERRKMRVVYAESGRQALSLLDTTPDVDIVLMDVMMPQMDGYETMRAVRRIERLKELPIISLTAKAMKGDREKCIEAGASDYIAKPVDTDHLCSLLRVWLSR